MSYFRAIESRDTRGAMRMSANGKIKVIFEKDKNGLFKSFSIESPFKPDKEKEQEPKTYKTFKDVTLVISHL